MSNYKKTLNRRKYQKIRKAAFERDNYTCQECGVIARPPNEIHPEDKNEMELPWGFALDVTGTAKATLDHIVPVSLDGDPYDIDNMQTLCFYCHDMKTREENAVMAEKEGIPSISCISCQEKMVGARSFKKHMKERHNIAVSIRGLDLYSKTGK